MSYADIYARWKADPEGFWMEAARSHRVGAAALPRALRRGRRRSTSGTPTAS